MEVQVGLRVVRGPDWEWGDQDGGEGHVGTVVEVGEPPVSDGGRAVVVQWDCGERCKYRCGLEGKYDLRVLDNAPTGVAHTGVQCDVCNKKNLTGMRWKCTRCYDYDLCPICYMAGKHIFDHEFTRYDKSHGLKHYIPARTGARRVMARGAFPRAEVTRATDWDYGDDDGGAGKTGKAVILKDWNESSFRSAIDVTWSATDKTIKCRLGYDGKVDIKYTTPSPAGYYYPDHLPVLGAPHRPPGPRDFCSGDYVTVIEDVTVADNQDTLALESDQIGMIYNILDNGEAMVKFGRNSERKLQPQQLTKANIPMFESGESVRIIDDMAEVMKLQSGHGGWNDDMGCTIGQLGVALGQNYSGDVVVSIDKTLYIFNHKCLVRTPDEKIEVNIEDVSFHQRNSSELEAEVQTLFEQNDSLVLCRAAQIGDETVIREFLKKFRNEVDREFDGKTALHHAAFSGHTDVIKTLLEFGADKDITDSNGLTALHFCAFRDEPESAKALLAGGADPNIADQLGRTPLILAAYRKSNRTVDALVDCSRTNLDAQDKEGDTALHCAVYGNWHMAVRPLVFAGANPGLENSRQLSPIHLACAIGFTAAVEVMLKQNPNLIHLKNKEGCTPLHLAALNNHSSIVTCLLKYDCDLNIKSLNGHTALHGAIISGDLKTIEKLVGLGANVSAQDKDGDSPLHLIRHSKAEEEVTDQSPQMMEIKQELECFEGVTPHAVLACFLIRSGADIFLKNNAGITALQGLPTTVAVIAASYTQKHQS